MARIGRFGRMPRSAPDLTGTIVAMLREYSAQVDRNMLDAWKSGGDVDGQPVTDERLIKHLKTRRDELPRTDPMWAEWDNRMTQYEFSIDDSKMRVRWDNGKATEQQMSDFYRKWEQKTPDNTEFDRTLRSSIGTWAQAAAAKAKGNLRGGRGRGGSARAEADAHDKKVTSIYNSQVKTGEYLNAELVGLAKAIGIISDQNASTLTDTEIKQEDIEMLLEIVTTGKALDPIMQGAVDNATVNMKKIDPKFEWSNSYINGKMDDAAAGFIQLIDGSANKTEAKGWIKRKEETAIAGNRVMALGPMAVYIAAREAWEDKMAASGNNVETIDTATREYVAAISSVYGDITSRAAQGGSDAALTGPLAQEIAYLNRGLGGEMLNSVMPPTLFDNSTGSSADSGPDAQSWTGILNANTVNRGILARGGWVEPGIDGTSQSPTVKYHEPTDPPRYDMVPVPGAMTIGGRPVMMWVAPQAVQVVMPGASAVRTGPDGYPISTDPGTGAQLPTTDPKYVENLQENTDAGFSVLTYPDADGNIQTRYHSVTADGMAVITLTPPIRNAVVKSDGKGGFVVMATPEEGRVTTPGVPSIFDPKKHSTTANMTNAAALSDPNVFLSDAGADAMSDFNAIDTTLPGWQKRQNALFASNAAKPAAMLALAAEMRRNGDVPGAQAVEAEAAGLGRDMIKVDSALKSQTVERNFGQGIAPSAVTGGGYVAGTPKATNAVDIAAHQRALDSIDKAQQDVIQRARFVNPEGAFAEQEKLDVLRGQVAATSPKDFRELKLPNIPGLDRNPYQLGLMVAPPTPTPASGVPGIQPPGMRGGLPPPPGSNLPARPPAGMMGVPAPTPMVQGPPAPSTPVFKPPPTPYAGWSDRTIAPPPPVVPTTSWDWSKGVAPPSQYTPPPPPPTAPVTNYAGRKRPLL